MNLSDAIFRMISATEATSSALDQMRTLSEQPMLCTESAPSTSALSLPEALRGIGLSLPAHPPAAQTAGKSRSEGRRAKHKNYKCRQCAHISMSKDEMWTHAREHIPKEKRMECEKCNFVTEYKHHLEYHNRNHAGLKPFQCKLCAYTCVNKSMLNSHMKSHSTTYMFKCKNCTYATKYCQSLKLHLKKYEHIRNVEPSKDEDSAPNAVEATPPSAELLSRLNAILEEYLGVNDDQLALQMAELAQQTDSFALLTEKIRATDLAVFQMSSYSTSGGSLLICDNIDCKNAASTSSRPSNISRI